VAETFLAVKLSGDDGNEMQERVMILLAIYLPLPTWSSREFAHVNHEPLVRDKRKALKNDSRQKPLVLICMETYMLC
jgi:hypothetical protein